MLIEQVKQEANRLKMKYHTADPFEICRDMKIQLLQTPMGTHAGSCKGFFVLNARIKVIALNSDLPEHVQRVILAHELGHASLHTREAICTFHDFAMLNETSRLEYEANVFASEFLLEDSDVMQALNAGMDFFRVASYMNVPPEMLDFKLKLMEKQGFPIKAPNISKSTFLKRNIDGPMN